MKRTYLLLAVFFFFWMQEASAFNLLSFDGTVDLKSKELNVFIGLDGQKVILAKAQKLNDTDYHLSLHLDHLKTSQFDLTSRIQGSLGLLRTESNDLQIVNGKVWSEYSLIDYKPIEELSGHFEVINNQLHLIGLSFANISCSGSIDLSSPFKTNLNFILENISLDHFLNFWVRGKDFDSSGSVSGQVKVSGDLFQPFLKGSLETYSGYVKNLNFDSIYLNVEGSFPNLTIAHSTISETGGMSFTIDGAIDLADKDNFKKQIKALNISPLVSNTATSSEWTIKRLEDNNQGATEIKYFLRKDEDSGPASYSQDSGMLGVLKTVEF